MTKFWTLKFKIVCNSPLVAELAEPSPIWFGQDWYIGTIRATMSTTKIAAPKGKLFTRFCRVFAQP
ncbi:hypothetical protein EDF58_1268 [Novosphingobium sp. PhB57]|nr:hypothetical protein EDF58_1268 [Novosphingobium sp. PhB57]